jgi:hypothetical protein
MTRPTRTRKVPARYRLEDGDAENHERSLGSANREAQQHDRRNKRTKTTGTKDEDPQQERTGARGSSSSSGAKGRNGKVTEFHDLPLDILLEVRRCTRFATRARL